MEKIEEDNRVTFQFEKFRVIIDSSGRFVLSTDKIEHYQITSEEFQKICAERCKLNG